MPQYVEVEVDNVYRSIMGICDEYMAGVETDVDAECHAAAKDACAHLKADIGRWSQTEDLPEREALTYEKGWKVYHHQMRDGHAESVVANKNAPSLTHLIEKGHELFVFGRDTGRRTQPRPHIRQAYEDAAQRHFTGGGAT